MIAGNTTDYVNSVLGKVSAGDKSGGLEKQKMNGSNFEDALPKETKADSIHCLSFDFSGLSFSTSYFVIVLWKYKEKEACTQG